MSNYFAPVEGKSLVAKRMMRLSRLAVLPLPISLSVIFYYIKKMLGKKGSVKEQANNYYFLTLLNTGSKHRKKEKHLLLFRHQNDFSFYARENPGSDLEVFNQVWGRKEYGEATKWLKKKNGDRAQYNIIDAGANVGYATLFFLAEFPQARVVSIEPETENCAIIRKNLAVNNLTAQVDLKQNGLWNKRSYLRIGNEYRDGRSWSTTVTESAVPTSLLAISLGDILAENKWTSIDLLKIDIEGSEKQLFDDEQEIEKILSITTVLAIEIHDDKEVDRARIYSLLKKCSFTFYDHNDFTIAYK